MKSNFKQIAEGIEAEECILLFFLAAASLIPSFLLFNTGHQFVAFLAFIISIMSLLLLLRWWAYRMRRLRNLQQVVKEFQQGDESARVIVSANDELSYLEDAYNKLADQVVAGNEAILRNDVLRRELIANISHDLRTPATALRGFAETLTSDSIELSDNEKLQCLNSIIRSAKSLEALINDLFELTKLDAKIKVPTMSVFRINEWLDQVSANFSVKAKERGIKLIFESHSSEAKVYGDLELLERAVSNIIGNAINYTPENGEVKIITYQRENSYWVEIKDSGIGIPKEHLPHIFERFKRVDSDRSRKTGGVGLGLAIAKKILDLHDSSISVESQLGQGTSVSFDLSLG